MLARPAMLAQLGSIAASHHERIDGSGYHRARRRGGDPDTRPADRNRRRLPRHDRTPRVPACHAARQQAAKELRAK